MKIAVIYKSNYGTTKQYATWIAEALGAELFERNAVSPEMLAQFDMVIYGGGLYASGILGINLVTENPCKKLVVFTVGLANPSLTDYSAIIEKNLPAELRSCVKVFHLRGGIDYGTLGIMHRGMMAMMKKMTIGKKAYDELTDEGKAFIDTYGKKVDFTNRQTILPLVQYVKNQTAEME